MRIRCIRSIGMRMINGKLCGNGCKLRGKYGNCGRQASCQSVIFLLSFLDSLFLLTTENGYAFISSQTEQSKRKGVTEMPMHPARESFLAQKIAPSRKVVKATRDAKGNYYVFDCGHSISTAPHFQMSKIGAYYTCRQCGKEMLPNHPVYGKEYE